MTQPFEEDLPLPGRTRSLGSRVLMAAMLGLLEGVGFDRPPLDVVQFAPDLNTGDLPLTFGPLPPLD